MMQSMKSKNEGHHTPAPRQRVLQPRGEPSAIPCAKQNNNAMLFVYTAQSLIASRVEKIHSIGSSHFNQVGTGQETYFVTSGNKAKI